MSIEDDKTWDNKMEKEDEFSELIIEATKDIRSDTNEMYCIGERMVAGMTCADWSMFCVDEDAFCEMIISKMNKEIRNTAEFNAHEMLS